MDAWVWIVIVIAVIVVLALAFLAWRRSGRVQEQKREEAAELRRDAHARGARASERERLAEEQASQARAEREKAESLAQRADEVDPDVDR